MTEYLYFTAKWCKPCQQLAPIMEQVSNSVPVKKIDIDENPQITSQWNVRGVPTVILTDGGVEINRYVGVKPLGTYLAV